MADFDQEDAVEMGGGAGKAPRRRIASDFDDEDEAPAGEGEGQQPQAQSRPPMKSWGDSSSGAPVQPSNNAVSVESGAISSNMGDDGATSSDAPKQGFGRRAAGRGANNAPKSDVQPHAQNAASRLQRICCAGH